MRVLLDTKVWINLKEQEDFLEEFRRLYDDYALEIVFSHGNFLDLVRRDHQDELAPIIDEFTDEYLGPFNHDPVGEYLRSEQPLVLTTIDKTWHQYCLHATQGMNSVETLQALFRDADFDAEPASSVMMEFIEGTRRLETLDPEGRMQIPDDVPQSVALKKIGVFAEYAKQRSDGMAILDDADIPLKQYIFGMSMIYISETHHDPEPGDYRDAVIWSQAISCECDVLWTETQWKYEHPVINQVLDRLERKPLEIVKDSDEFKKLFQ